MKKIVTFTLVAPGSALAHAGHPELAGPAGHDIAHLLIGGGIALAAVAGLALLHHRRSADRHEE